MAAYLPDDIPPVHIRQVQIRDDGEHGFRCSVKRRQSLTPSPVVFHLAAEVFLQSNLKRRHTLRTILHD